MLIKAGSLQRMNWDRIKARLESHWKHFRGRARRQASEKQLAEWLAREHKADPIHK